MQGSNKAQLSDIPLVIISPKGIFKYILIKAKINNKGQESTVNFVRGDQNNFEKFINQVKGKGFEIKKKNVDGGKFEANKGDCKVKFQCPGGGRIQHNYEGKKCHIYGHSKSYGHVDHTIAQKQISQALGYPLNEITTSKEGY